MRRPRKTINAAMLTTAVRIHTGFKTHVRALVMSDDCFCGIAKIQSASAGTLGFRRGILLHYVGIFEIDMQFFETISRAPRSAAPVNRRRRRWSLIHDRDEFLFPLRLCRPLAGHAI